MQSLPSAATEAKNQPPVYKYIVRTLVGYSQDASAAYGNLLHTTILPPPGIASRRTEFVSYENKCVGDSCVGKDGTPKDPESRNLHSGATIVSKSKDRDLVICYQ
jgi:hypothetical protein